MENLPFPMNPKQIHPQMGFFFLDLKQMHPQNSNGARERRFAKILYYINSQQSNYKFLFGTWILNKIGHHPCFICHSTYALGKLGNS